MLTLFLISKLIIRWCTTQDPNIRTHPSVWEFASPWVDPQELEASDGIFSSMMSNAKGIRRALLGDETYRVGSLPTRSMD